MTFAVKRWIVSVGAVALFAWLAIPAAHATFPGKNGRIAFVFGPDIYTMNPDGSDVRQLTNMVNDNSASWESWSADGRKIVFCEFPAPDFTGQLWIMDADGGNRHLLLAEPGFSELRPSFSPDGNTVIFSRGYTILADPRLPLIVQLYRINVDGTGLIQITTHTTPGVHDYGARYSPDGRTIYFQADQAGGIMDAIYAIDAARTDSPREITPAEIGARRSDVSPDGRSIAFQTHCCNPQNQTIAVIGSHGGGMRELTHNGNDYDTGPHDNNPSWSPDGNWIVFERLAPDFSSSSIYVIRADTGEMRRVIALPATRNLNFKPGTARPGESHGRDKAAVPTEIELGGSLARWGPMPN
jgi:Tol biopolymer transport system component